MKNVFKMLTDLSNEECGDTWRIFGTLRNRFFTVDFVAIGFQYESNQKLNMQMANECLQANAFFDS